VNDTLGHPYGDQLLQQVGQRLRGALRESDTVARLGGDEFAILLPGTDDLDAVRAAERLLKALDLPFPVREQSLNVEASIGIALYPEHGEDEEALLRHADVAMYVAKRTEDRYVMYAPEQDRDS